MSLLLPPQPHLPSPPLSYNTVLAPPTCSLTYVYSPAQSQHCSCSSHLQPKLGYDPDGSGYHFKRHDFDPEWDNDAECIIADMEFTDADTEEDRRQKLRMLEIYNKCVWEVWGSSGECGVRVFGSRAVAGIHGVEMALSAGAEGAGGGSSACSICVQVCGAVWGSVRRRAVAGHQGVEMGLTAQRQGAGVTDAGRPQQVCGRRRHVIATWSTA